ncbi:MAG: TatD family hydrolase [Promethearchaeota archaeon]
MLKKVKVPEPEKGLNFIDAHCHIPFPRPKKDILPSDEDQYKTYFENGGLYLITCSIDMETLNLILKFIENKDKKKIGFTNGWAPQTVTYTSKLKYKKEWKEWIDFTLNNPNKYLAIGEIGLDFHHAKTLKKRNQQITELKKILELTKGLEKPYTLHVRNAAKHEMDRENPNHRFNKPDGANIEILKILEDFKINSKSVMWHCFSGPEAYGVSLPKQGFTLSVPSSAFGQERWRKVSAKSPLASLVTETDSYYQHPYMRGPVNVPSNAIYSIAAIAYTHGVSQKEVSEKTIQNIINFFNLELG